MAQVEELSFISLYLFIYLFLSIYLLKALPPDDFLFIYFLTNVGV